MSNSTVDKPHLLFRSDVQYAGVKLLPPTLECSKQGGFCTATVDCAEKTGRPDVCGTGADCCYNGKTTLPINSCDFNTFKFQ